MDYDDDNDVAAMLGGQSSGTAGSKGPCPRPGQNAEFDDYCAVVLAGDDDDDVVDIGELRKALWATWKTGAPSARNAPVRADEDHELARALTLSAQEHSAKNSRQGSVLEVPDDSDEELRRAIALSEAEARGPKRQKVEREETPEEEKKMLAEAMKASMTPAIVSDQSDDEDLRSANDAFQASRQAFREEEMRRRQTQSKAVTSTSQPPPDVSGQSSIVGSILSDRAQMEKERLARQAARLGQTATVKSEPRALSASQASSAPGPSSTLNVVNKAVVGNAPIAVRGPPSSAGPSRNGNGSTSTNGHSKKGKHPLQADGPFPSDRAGEYYPDGELRHSALTIGSPSSERTFSPEQLIGRKSEISLIILSSFVLDDEWLSGVLPPSDQVPTIIIRPHPKEMHPDWNGKVQAQAAGEVYCYPEMVGEWGSAHMKFAWIFYKTGRLRVAIMTANMVPYDWDWIENTIFIQDFLPLSRPRDPPPKGQDFTSRFRHLFVHLKVHKALRHLVNAHPQGRSIGFTPNEAFEDMDKWDWSQVRVRLVMSVPGSYQGVAKMEDFGLCRLGKVVEMDGWRCGKGEMVKGEYQGSSLGTYSLDWFSTFYNLVCGRTIATLIGRPKSNAWPPLNILFPSLATVEKSELGKDGGGTMFCGKAINAVTRPLFRDSNSKRGGILMHSKMLIALFEPRPNHLGLESSPAKAGKRKVEEMEDDISEFGGWVYVGSHNFSSAAWGTVSLKSKPPKLTVRNYELGIAFPLPREGARAAADRIAPYTRPARKYTADDEPWDQRKHGVDPKNERGVGLE